MVWCHRHISFANEREFFSDHVLEYPRLVDLDNKTQQHEVKIAAVTTHTQHVVIVIICARASFTK